MASTEYRPKFSNSPSGQAAVPAAMMNSAWTAHGRPTLPPATAARAERIAGWKR